MATGGIFISYRRADVPMQARTLFSDLTAQFGKDGVFLDRRGIGVGQDFLETIRRELNSARVLLALIGPQWTPARLQNADDFVRLELLVAKERGVAIIPVLIAGGTVPAEKELPPELAFFSRLNAAPPISVDNWESDVAALVTALQPLLASSDRSVETARRRISLITVLAVSFAFLLMAAAAAHWFASHIKGAASSIELQGSPSAAPSAVAALNLGDGEMIDGAVLYSNKPATINTDGPGGAISKAPDWQPQTTLTDFDETPLDSTKIPFVGWPMNLLSVKEGKRVFTRGDYVVVFYPQTDRWAIGIIGDTAPRTRFEISIFLADQVQISSAPGSTDVTHGVYYLAFPNSRQTQRPTAESVAKSGEGFFAAWGGIDKLKKQIQLTKVRGKPRP